MVTEKNRMAMLRRILQKLISPDERSARGMRPLFQILMDCPEGISAGDLSEKLKERVKTDTSLKAISRQIKNINGKIIESQKKRDLFGISVEQIAIRISGYSGRMKKSDIVDIVFGKEAEEELTKWKPAKNRQKRKHHTPSRFFLPAPPKSFFGRVEDIQKVKRALKIDDEEVAIIAVYGLPGVGKTVFSAKLAHDIEVKGQYAGRILWVPFGQHAEIEERLNHIFQSLGGQRRQKSLVEEINIILQENPMFIILDDIWDAEHVAVIIRAIPNRSSLLFTTRFTRIAQDISRYSGFRYKLDILSEKEALEFLLMLAPSQKEKEEKAAILVKKLGQLPLAIHVAGHLLQTESELGLGYGIEDLLDELDEEKILSEPLPPDMVDEEKMLSEPSPPVTVESQIGKAFENGILKNDDEDEEVDESQMYDAEVDEWALMVSDLREIDEEQNKGGALGNLGEEGYEITATVNTLLKKSTDRLKEDSRTGFAVLGAFAPSPASFDVSALSVVWFGIGPKHIVRDLVARGLIEIGSEKGRFEVHPILSMHARSLCRSIYGSVSVRISQALHAKNYLTVLTKTAEQCNKNKGNLQTILEGFEKEWPQISHGQSWAAKFHGVSSTASKICCEFPHWGIEMLQVRLGINQIICWIEDALHSIELFKEQWESIEGIETHRLEIHLHLIKSSTLKRKGETRLAHDHYVKAQKKAQESKDINSLNDLIRIDIDVDELDWLKEDPKRIRERIELEEELLIAYRESEDKQRILASLVQLGKLYRASEEFSKAIKLHSEALKVSRDQKDPFSESRVLNEMGADFFLDGEPQKAIKHTQLSIEIAQSLGHRKREEVCLFSLGMIYKMLSIHENAVDYLIKAKEIAQELGDTERVVEIESIIGQIRRSAL